MVHVFQVSEAKDYGVECAVIVQRLRDIPYTNAANGNNNESTTIKELNDYLPYLSQKQIRTRINKLINLGIVVESESNNNHHMEQNKWYKLRY